MVILFVIDNIHQLSNGTTITTKRYIEALRKRGHEVRILSIGSNDIEGLYPLPVRYIPIVSEVAAKQDVSFSKPDRQMIEKALVGVDVVHLVTPWKTSRVVRKIASQKNIPTTASFHIQPENITFGAGLNHFGFINKLIYRRFRRFYEKISYTHAPSNFIAQELKNNHYPTTIKVISNGVSDVFFDIKNQERKDKFTIVSTGRYAKEKRQIVLLKAVASSKYKDQIKIVLPGQGPYEKRLRKYAEEHNLDVEFGFKKQDELIKTLSEASLYVHAAYIEIEAIACLEAIAAGLVPVIANSKKSATPQFALTEKNLFKPNDENSLRERIEFFIENPLEKEKLRIQYQSFSNKYRLDYSINLFEEMLRLSIQDQRAYNLSKSVKGKVFNQRLNSGPFKKTISAMTYYLFALPLLFLYFKFILNVKFVDRKYIRGIKGGAVLVSNHVHTLDSVMNSFAAFPRRPVMTAMKANFDLPIAGIFVNLLGAVPIPDNLLETQIFFKHMSEKAKRGRLIHIYPEGELITKDKNLRTFKRGAFQLAVQSSVPIVPIHISFIEYKFFIWQREKIVCRVGMPIYPDLTIPSDEALNKLMEQTTNIMNELTLN
ncbi:glycosyltransferase [Acholeplasma equifetale]|uniref:glycosyltransferase n=1 Tax=Acholeplasma equifetale TaxID=264634 RepID=UPI00068F02CC|nr:glycosyltransferase [Acholeplasma equifetale]